MKIAPYAFLLALAAAAQETPQWRPLFHFTPPRNFMNDPNGLVYYRGDYHLFYQHNPFGEQWGHMSWGHAVSKDMVRWEHLPVALPEENGIMIFSGSAVVDRQNSSGLCREQDCLVAIYTGHTDNRQTQNLAVSDDGRNFHKFPGNPVIDLNERNFRDPKVFWHEPTRRWIMVTVLAREKKVRFFGSADLKQWTALSDFGPAGATGGVWECPDLFPLPVDGNPKEIRWMLDVDINPGAVAGGSGGQYFIGTFDGIQFVNENPPDQVLWVDYGKDFYATTSFSELPATDLRRIWIGWLSNWLYANKEPTSPWKGMQSFPRSLKLKRFADGIRLIQEPIVEMETLRGAPVEVKGKMVRGSLPLPLRSQTFEAIAEFEAGSAAEYGFKVRKSGTEETVVGLRTSSKDVFIDRSRSGRTDFSDQFSGRHEGPLRPSRRVKLHVFVDRSSVEVFANDGETVISDRIFPAESSDGIEVYATGGEARLVKLRLWPLRR